MKLDYISFDLQGTLSDNKFSDEFWFEVLPKLYADAYNIRYEESKKYLESFFSEIGKYDYRYYSVNYWLKRLGNNLNFEDVCRMIKSTPLLYPDTLELIEELKDKANIIIISSTVKEFIGLELGECRKYFKHIYSSIDDFGIAGKPRELYEKISAQLGFSPDKVLHIGDSKEMDIDNAKQAGLKTFYFDRTQKRAEVVRKLREEIGKFR